MPENLPRKFIHLIWQSSGKWTSWSPGSMMLVGDFGQINKETGEMEVEGNIYKDLHIYNGDTAITKLLEDNPPINAFRENDFIATSSNVRRGDFQQNLGGSDPEVSEASLKGQWTFGPQRGALLIMAQPTTSYIPPDTFLERLAKVEYLKDKHLITKVFSTSAFSLCLSDKNNEVVSLALLGSIPETQAPEVPVGNVNQAGMQWWWSDSSGLVRSGHDPLGNDSYKPLYVVKEVRKKALLRRGSPTPFYEGDDLWDDLIPQWQLLDEDGNEDIFVDTLSLRGAAHRSRERRAQDTDS